MQPDRPEPDDAEELAWRAIVENYGERPDLGEPPTAPPADAAAGEEPSAPTGSTAPFGGRFGDLRSFPENEDEPFVGDDDRYEPPAPPPLPHVAPDRALAWVGIFGSPAVLLACLVFSISLPPLLGYALVAAFVGGFVYLVYKMPRGPRDPWDDGAQV